MCHEVHWQNYSGSSNVPQFEKIYQVSDHVPPVHVFMTLLFPLGTSCEHLSEFLDSVLCSKHPVESLIANVVSHYSTAVVLHPYVLADCSSGPCTGHGRTIQTLGSHQPRDPFCKGRPKPCKRYANRLAVKHWRILLQTQKTHRPAMSCMQVGVGFKHSEQL